MTDTTTFDRPSYLCDERAWVRRLDYAIHAVTVAMFKKRLTEWLRFFPDAAEQIAAIKTSEHYEEFRRGLQSEREGTFAGEEWMKKYGAILIPANAMRATAIAEQFQAPWGAALVRVKEWDDERTTPAGLRAPNEGE